MIFDSKKYKSRWQMIWDDKMRHPQTCMLFNSSSLADLAIQIPNFLTKI